MNAYHCNGSRGFCPDRARVRRPGSLCASCSSAASNLDRADRLGKRLDMIPPRFRWSRFGAPELGGSATAESRLEYGDRVRAARAIDRAERWHREGGRLLCLRGPTGSGKTSLVSAVYRAEVLAGNERAAFVLAEHLSIDADERDRARARAAIKGATFVAIDDAGAELAGAPEGGGILAMRRQGVYDLIRDAYNREIRLAITTGFAEEQFAAGYGDDGRRRAMPRPEEADRGTCVITMGVR